MNLIFLSPHFPQNFYHFCVQLSSLGVKVLGIAEQPFDALRPELKKSLADYFQVSSMEDYDQVVRATGWFIHRHGRINRVESHNEHWLPLEASLREDFNIPGVRREPMEKIRQKSRMKEVFIEAGIPAARGAIYKDLQSGLAFAAKVKFPVFLKPDVGVGAISTYKIHDKKEFEDFAASKSTAEYYMEEFIDGQLATFDGITDQTGEIVYYTSHFSDTGVFEVVQGNEDLNFYSLREVPSDILDYGAKAVKAFGVKEKFFHIEFLRQKSDGKLMAMELNMRPPGGFSTDMMNFASDLDVYREWSNIVVNNTFEAPITRKYHCAHVARKFGKAYRLSHDEVLSRFGTGIVSFSEVSEIFSPVMGNFAYLIRAPELAEIKNMISEIQAKA